MIIATRRLFLREFTPEDWQAMLEYQSDPLYLRFNPWTHRTAKDVKIFIQMFIDQQKEQPRAKYQLAITLPENGRLIGNCGIRKGDAASQEAEIGYELDPRQWGKGYATEAAGAMVEFGFAQLNIRRVTAHCLAENTASVRVLEKLGLRQVKRLRNHEYLKGRWWDRLVFAMEREKPAAVHKSESLQG